jgi:uncharacterized protein YajQ (UPF0234 family)
MPSFDIVSKTEMAEVDNAIAGIGREIAQRFDFKGSNCTVERKESEITVLADDELKLKQLQELLKVYFTRRNVDPKALDFKPQERAAGDKIRQVVLIKQGIDRDLAKTLIAAIKDSKSKVQVSIQGDELRVTGKKRDELQEVIALCRKLQSVDRPLQYVNFRD